MVYFLMIMAIPMAIVALVFVLEVARCLLINHSKSFKQWYKRMEKIYG